jgi:hypothetical protein
MIGPQEPSKGSPAGKTRSPTGRIGIPRTAIREEGQDGSEGNGAPLPGQGEVFGQLAAQDVPSRKAGNLKTWEGAESGPDPLKGQAIEDQLVRGLNSRDQSVALKNIGPPAFFIISHGES